MKKMRSLFFLLVAGLLSLSARADVTFSNISTYLGAYGTGNFTSIIYYLDVLTPEGVYHGEYYQDNYQVRQGDLPNRVWTGPGAPPTMRISSNGVVTSIANCPGLAAMPGWACEDFGVDITVHGTTHGCPWIVTTTVKSTTSSPLAKDKTYLGPKANQTQCPAEPVAPYDVSWDENYVAHNKTVRLSGGSGVVTQTLSTYLMKDGQLCDGSRLDERGAYCRLVAQLMTFTASGCDDARVSVTPTPQPLINPKLHDMVLQVNTSNNVPAIAATCRFQYILNEL